MQNGKNQKPFNPFLEKLNGGSTYTKPPTLDELEVVVCAECGNSIFDRYFKMYKLSALKTASGKVQHFNVPVYVCASCSAILDMSNNDNAVSEESIPKKETEK